MTVRPLMLSLAIVSALAAGCTQQAPATPPEAATLRTLGSLTFKPCSLASPSPYGKPMEAQCTTLDVPEDRSKPGGRSIDLTHDRLPLLPQPA